jgi:ABC-type sugar transport system ATPase subunit
MNLMAGQVVEKTGDKAVVEVVANGAPRLEFALPDAAVGDALTLGVRPEVLAIIAADASGMTALPAKVESIERLGNITFAYLDAGTSELLTMQVIGHSDLEPEDTVRVGIRTQDVHVFNAAGAVMTSAIQR